MIRNHITLTARNGKYALASAAGVDALRLLTFGNDAIDRRIGGGLACAAVHELFAASLDDGSAAAALGIMIAMRGCALGKPIFWVREDRGMRNSGRLHGAGLAELGFDPDNLVLISAIDTLSVLRVSADIVKCGQVGAVIIEPWGKAPLLDLTASRRLAMAAAASDVLTLILRVGADPAPSAAQTRWEVSAVCSTPLVANAPGHPAFNLSLLRHRGGIAGFDARLEWNRDKRSFAPLLGSFSAVPSFGADQAVESLAA